MSSGKFFHPRTLERLAAELLVPYQRKTGQVIRPPISAERVAEVCYDLAILWDGIAEGPGMTVLGALAPRDRLIVLNETRRSLFDEDPGLYNTVVGHEVAHWRLHVDPASLGQPVLPGIERDLTFVCTRDADAWDERNAHRFMSHLLLPTDLLCQAMSGVDLQDWHTLYRLRNHFDVTISVLRIRLEQLGLTYADEQGRLHRSRQEALGQRRML